MEGKNRESHASSVEESTNLQRSSYEDFAKSLVENEDLVYLGLVDLHAESRFESFEKWIAENRCGSDRNRNWCAECELFFRLHRVCAEYAVDRKNSIGRNDGEGNIPSM